MQRRKNLYTNKKKPTSKTKRNKWLLILFLISSLYIVFFYTNDHIINRAKYALENTENNYGKDVDSLSKTMNLPPDYIKALIMLESGGRKPVPSRFEEHVYKKLKEVKTGKRPNYEGITMNQLRYSTDHALRNMATSWGPFQIMGYKCIQLRIKLHNLRGESALYWGMKWISDDYGYLLKDKRYKDAFHFHNTGKEFPLDGKPQTHDPNYVAHGIKYMTYFLKKEKK